MMDLIKTDYDVHLILDNLPVARKYTSPDGKIVSADNYILQHFKILKFSVPWVTGVYFNEIASLKIQKYLTKLLCHCCLL